MDRPVVMAVWFLPDGTAHARSGYMLADPGRLGVVLVWIDQSEPRPPGGSTCGGLCDLHQKHAHIPLEHWQFINGTTITPCQSFMRLAPDRSGRGWFDRITN